MRIRFLGREDGGIPVISRKIVDKNRRRNKES